MLAAVIPTALPPTSHGTAPAHLSSRSLPRACDRLISVKLLEDRQLERKGAAYRTYKRAVPSPLLLLPPAVSRVLGKLRRND